MIRSYRSALVISLFLTLATIAVFWQLPSHDFITIDDNVYVTNNPYVDAGADRQEYKMGVYNGEGRILASVDLVVFDGR